MAYTISALVSRYALLARLPASAPQVRVIALPQAFGLIPVTDELYGSFLEANPAGQTQVYPRLTFLTENLMGLLSDTAEHAPVAYIEADYFGGVGTQAALGWHRDERLGPFITESRPDVPREPDPEQWAINRVLRYLGVEKGAAFDAFDALGLGRQRNTSRWV